MINYDAEKFNTILSEDDFLEVRSRLEEFRKGIGRIEDDLYTLRLELEKYWKHYARQVPAEEPGETEALKDIIDEIEEAESSLENARGNLLEAEGDHVDEALGILQGNFEDYD